MSISNLPKKLKPGIKQLIFLTSYETLTLSMLTLSIARAIILKDLFIYCIGLPAAPVAFLWGK